MPVLVAVVRTLNAVGTCGHAANESWEGEGQPCSASRPRSPSQPRSATRSCGQRMSGRAWGFGCQRERTGAPGLGVGCSRVDPAAVGSASRTPGQTARSRTAEETRQALLAPASRTLICRNFTETGPSDFAERPASMKLRFRPGRSTSCLPDKTSRKGRVVLGCGGGGWGAGRPRHRNFTETGPSGIAERPTSMKLRRRPGRSTSACPTKRLKRADHARVSRRWAGWRPRCVAGACGQSAGRALRTGSEASGRARSRRELRWVSPTDARHRLSGFDLGWAGSGGGVRSAVQATGGLIGPR
jgi:hypothetical protein